MKSKNLHVGQVATTDRGWLFWLPAMGWAGLIFVASSVPGESLPKLPEHVTDKIAHFAVYLTLGVFTTLGLRRGWGWAHRKAIAATIAATIVYGLSDEFHQSFVPHRTPDWRDLLADAIGGLVGAAIALVLLRLRERRAADAAPTR